MSLLGATLKNSGAAMVSVHCSSGYKSILRFIEAIKKDSKPFREPWEKKDDGEESKLPIRPLVFAITIPSYFDPATAAPAFGDYHRRMMAYNALIAKPLFDGVVCTPKTIRDYDGSSSDYGHVKKMVFNVAPEHLNMPETITPTQAIQAGADYMVIKEPIISLPQNQSMADETKKILEEVSVALEKKEKIKAASKTTAKLRAVPAKTVTVPLTTIIGPPPHKPEKKNLPKKEKKTHKLFFI
jgi:hypothetical protein